jgi:hypothetical protein
MSLLFGFSGIELERKIKSFIVSFHNFGGPNLEFIGWGNYWKAKFQNMSLLFGFSGIEIGRKIKSFIVSFHNFGRPNLGIIWVGELLKS